MTNDRVFVNCSEYIYVHNVFDAFIPEEKSKLHSVEADSGEMLSLLLESSHEDSTQDVQHLEREREDSSHMECEGSVIKYLLHEDERDFKVGFMRA